MIRLLAPLLLLLLIGPGCSQGVPDNVSANTGDGAAVSKAETNAPEPLPDVVRVKLETEAGSITLALDARRAPITTANFVRYVDQHRFDGTFFYRAARTKNREKEGFIQGGIRGDYRRMLPPIAHEPTSRTGLHHEAGAISMAQREPGSAMGDFFIVTDKTPSMDAKPGAPGYAVFGKVVDGMATVRKILASPTAAGGSGAMKGQIIEKPVRIVKAERMG
ncbi:MAG TPA: peptidylprolyl isomerase [Allosphingosinicella sp.]|nr:peptidylprolyl isomerase [Allosphingosinicella sp.]